LTEKRKSNIVFIIAFANVVTSNITAQMIVVLGVAYVTRYPLMTKRNSFWVWKESASHDTVS